MPFGIAEVLLPVFKDSGKVEEKMCTATRYIFQQRQPFMKLADGASTYSAADFLIKNRSSCQFFSSRPEVSFLKGRGKGIASWMPFLKGKDPYELIGCKQTRRQNIGHAIRNIWGKRARYKDGTTKLNNKTPKQTQFIWMVSFYSISLDPFEYLIDYRVTKEESLASFDATIVTKVFHGNQKTQKELLPICYPKFFTDLKIKLHGVKRKTGIVSKFLTEVADRTIDLRKVLLTAGYCKIISLVTSVKEIKLNFKM